MNCSWPYQSAPYLSALPGVAGPGLDVSAGDKPSKIYFITSDADTSEGGSDPRGPNCYAGTLRWCWNADQGEDFHKYVIPLVGGYVKLGRGSASPYGRGDLDYIGHAAPGAGLFLRCGYLNQAGGSNVRIWHLPVWLGDEPSADGVDNFGVDMRDCLQASLDGYKARAVAFINCEARFAMDESVQVFYAMDGVSWIRGAIYDPLHIPPDFVIPGDANHPPDKDHGFGHLVGGSDFVDHSLVSQSLYAHTTDRNPLMCANNHSQVNCLHYNHGQLDIGGGAGIKVDDNGGHNAAAGKSMQLNVVGCVTVRGPNQGDGIILVEVQDVTPGSSGHAAFNSQAGWPAPDSQDAFFKKQAPDYLRPTLRTSAWPDGFGANYSGVLRPCADPLHPTTQELLQFAYLVRTTVGCMPARRWKYRGGVDKVMDQIDAAIRGVKLPPQYVNTVCEAGGFPNVPTGTLDPLNPGPDHHAPMPLGADRDDVLTAGTFSDGSSKAGYTKLRAWCIEQYFYVMGR